MDQGYNIDLRGLVLCKGEPWLAASPDGIIINTDQLLEIKSPVLGKNKTLISRWYSRWQISMTWWS